MIKRQPKTKEQQHEETLKRLAELRPIDDEFMRAIFKDDMPLAQMVLRIITGVKDLTLTSFATQYDMKRLAGARSASFDAAGTDSLGQKYDIEMERRDKRASAKRARYYSSLIDIDNLDAGEDFDKLPNTYVIFITEHDIFGRGEAIYPIERINTITGELFDDGEHIIYVNGAYEGDSEIGHLMHDFRCSNADDMYYELLAEKTRYYKETPKGASEMSKIMEDWKIEIQNETREENAYEFALKMLKRGRDSFDEIADLTGFTVEDVKEIAKENNIAIKV